MTDLDNSSLPAARAPARSQSRSPWLSLRSLPWLLIVLVCGGLAWMYWNRSELDPAIVNVGTLATAMLVWLCTWVGLWLNGSSRRWWLPVCLLPLLALGGFFALYRIERMDGQLSPIFRPRWATAPPLQQLAAGEPAVLAPTKFASGPNDYPQFLGPARTGVIPGVQLDADWRAKPPEVLWKIPIGDGWSGFAVQGEAAITMEQRDEQEWVSCYDLASGELLWKYEIPARHFNTMGGTGPRSTPTIANDKVYAMSAVSRLVCLELSTGEPIWQQELLDLTGTKQAAFEGRVAWGRSASPLLFEDKVIVSLGGAGDALNTLIAFDAATGQERWRTGTHQISYASPTLLNLLGKTQIAIVDEKSLTAFDPHDGGQVWSVPWPGSSSGAASVSQPLQVDERRVFMSKGYGTGCQLIELTEESGTWTARVVWQANTSLRTKFTSAVLHNGHAYGLSDGILECVDLSNGQRRWKKGRYQQGQVLLVGELLLITSEAGEIALVPASPEGYVELAKVDVIGDVTWNTAALSGDRLLMRNSDEAACVRLPVSEPAASTPTAPLGSTQPGGA
jgi:outer membrane protein assembly factor BamB